MKNEVLTLRGEIWIFFLNFKLNFKNCKSESLYRNLYWVIKTRSSVLFILFGFKKVKLNRRVFKNFKKETFHPNLFKWLCHDFLLNMLHCNIFFSFIAFHKWLIKIWVTFLHSPTSKINFLSQKNYIRLHFIVFF